MANYSIHFSLYLVNQKNQRRQRVHQLNAKIKLIYVHFISHIDVSITEGNIEAVNRNIPMYAERRGGYLEGQVGSSKAYSRGLWIIEYL